MISGLSLNHYLSSDIQLITGFTMQWNTIGLACYKTDFYRVAVELFYICNDFSPRGVNNEYLA